MYKKENEKIFWGNILIYETGTSSKSFQSVTASHYLMNATNFSQRRKHSRHV